MIYPRSFIPIPYGGKNEKRSFLRKRKRMGVISAVRNDCGK
jgi:hypothetical protein